MNLSFSDCGTTITLDKVEDQFGAKFRLIMLVNFEQEPLIDENYDEVDEAMAAYLKTIKYEICGYASEPAQFEGISI